METFDKALLICGLIIALATTYLAVTLYPTGGGIERCPAGWEHRIDGSCVRS